jgi:glutamate-5-semialdehyde dehydrogenase
MSRAAEEASPSPERLVEEACRRARAAAPTVATLPTGVKNDVLIDLAADLVVEADEILEANEQDIRLAERQRLPDPVIDRVTLTRERLGAIAEGVRAVAAFSDPVGEVLRGSRRPSGLIVQEIRVPLGVVAVICDGRPNTTVDAISLCLKAGNAVVLLGGEEAVHTDAALLRFAEAAISRHQVPEGAVQLIRTTAAGAREHLIRMDAYVDLLIPHGSSEMVRGIRGAASVPVIETRAGNCHTFVERSAKLGMAADIAFNAKVQRPGTVNAMETLLVDAPIAAEFLPLIGPRMQAAGVELRGCPRARAILPRIRAATDADWAEEFLSLILAVRVVDGMKEAIAHISRYGHRLSEAIVTQDYAAAKQFCEQVDAAAVYVNASTRFTDGYEFGLGAELGISTQKLHRRGPIGLRALTTWKWVVYGEGQVRL